MDESTSRGAVVAGSFVKLIRPVCILDLQFVLGIPVVLRYARPRAFVPTESSSERSARRPRRIGHGELHHLGLSQSFSCCAGIELMDNPRVWQTWVPAPHENGAVSHVMLRDWLRRLSHLNRSRPVHSR